MWQRFPPEGRGIPPVALTQSQKVFAAALVLTNQRSRRSFYCRAPAEDSMCDRFTRGGLFLAYNFSIRAKRVSGIEPGSAGRSAAVTRNADTEDQRRIRNCNRTGGSAANRCENSDRSRWLIWLRLRHFHTTRRAGCGRRQSIFEAASDRQADRCDRGSVAGDVQLFVLAQRAGAEQCNRRSGSGVMGYQGQTSRDACLRIARGQMQERCDDLFARRRREKFRRRWTRRGKFLDGASRRCGCR